MPTHCHALRTHSEPHRPCGNLTTTPSGGQPSTTPRHTPGGMLFSLKKEGNADRCRTCLNLEDARLREISPAPRPCPQSPHHPSACSPCPERTVAQGRPQGAAGAELQVCKVRTVLEVRGTSVGLLPQNWWRGYLSCCVPWLSFLRKGQGTTVAAFYSPAPVGQAG